MSYLGTIDKQMTQFTSLKLRQGMAVKQIFTGNNFPILELIESSSGNTVIWYNYFIIIIDSKLKVQQIEKEKVIKTKMRMLMIESEQLQSSLRIRRGTDTSTNFILKCIYTLQVEKMHWKTLNKKLECYKTVYHLLVYNYYLQACAILYN